METPHATLPHSRAAQQAKALFAGAAVLLVLLRSLVPLSYEGFNFGADQAIVGLMARHLSTLHDFPLYYYGLNYLLGVEAWIIAPFFVVMRSSVFAMRIPFVILNAFVAVWLMAEIRLRLNLSPAMAFVAALPFIMPNPAVAASLLDTAGACVEPFVYILLLWRLRTRPMAFGALLAFGSLHREFTLFALPAVLVAEASDGSLWAANHLRRVAWTACGFGVVWLIVDDLKMHLSGGALALQVSSLGNQMCVDREWPRRVAALIVGAVPAMFGSLEVVQFGGLRLDAGPRIFTVIVAALAALAALTIVVRLVCRRRAAGTRGGDGFALYLVCVGLFAACAYPLSCNVGLGSPPLLRYLLLALLIPVGLFAAFIAREPSRRLRRLVAAVFVVWASVNFADTGRLIVQAARHPPISDHRVLTDYLLDQHIRYARATYWDAYVVDFLSRERVIVASTDTIRVPEYQEQVDAHASGAAIITRQPCAGGETVAAWCVQR